jgi:hypothetical protein
MLKCLRVGYEILVYPVAMDGVSRMDDVILVS